MDIVVKMSKAILRMRNTIPRRQNRMTQTHSIVMNPRTSRSNDVSVIDNFMFW